MLNLYPELTLMDGIILYIAWFFPGCRKSYVSRMKLIVFGELLHNQVLE